MSSSLTSSSVFLPVGKMRTYWVNEDGKKSGEDKSAEFEMPVLEKTTSKEPSEDFMSTDFLLDDMQEGMPEDPFADEPDGPGGASSRRASRRASRRVSRRVSANVNISRVGFDIEAPQEAPAQDTAAMKAVGALASFVQSSQQRLRLNDEIWVANDDWEEEISV